MSCNRSGLSLKLLVSRSFPCGPLLRVASLLLISGLAQADALPHAWVEGGYQRFVPGGTSPGETHGEYIAGSYALTDQFNLHGDYHDQETDSVMACGAQTLLPPPPTYVVNCYRASLKNHGYLLGLGWHQAIADGVDLVATLAYESETVEYSTTLLSSSRSSTPPPSSAITLLASAYPFGHSTGGRGYAGVRINLVPRLELDGVFGRLHVGGLGFLPASAYNFLGGAAIYSITPSWAAVFDWSHQYLPGTQANTYRLGVRMVF